MARKPKNRVAFACALRVYLAGMLVWPAHWLILSGQGLSFLSLLQPLYYILFLAALPIAALVHAVFRTSHKAIAALYVAIAGFSLLPALFIAAISLPTFAKLTMISALNFSTLCLITAIYLAKFEYRKAKALRLLFSIAFLLPVWSFLSVPMLYVQAALKAEGRPYCVAFPSTSNARIYSGTKSFWGLRGISLAARETQGGSESYQFSFHALLFIQGVEPPLNWSKTTMKFTRLKHPELWSDLQANCPLVSQPAPSPFP